MKWCARCENCHWVCETLFEPALVRRSRLRLRRGRGAVSDLQRDGRTDHARDAGRRRTS